VRGGRGFTLLELLLSLSLTLVVMALSLPFVHAQKRLWERAEREREAVRALDGALAWIARDLRQAGYHVPGPAVLRAGEEGISYTVSRDGEDPAGFSQANRRLVTVYAGGGDLKYRVQAPEPPPGTGWARGSTQVLSPGIAGASCTAVDADGEPVADAATAALVTCSLVTDSGRTRTVTVRVRAPREGGG